MKHLFKLIAVVLLLFTQEVSAQWTTYTTSNSGIADNLIWGLAVDSSNTIWIATGYGLSRFDGSTWTTYDVDNAPIPAESNNDIYAVFVDDQDHVWIGTDAGHLLEFDHNANVWTDHTTFTFGDIQAIDQDQEGHLWVGHANGLQERIDGVWTEHLENLPGAFVTSIDIGQSNTVWVGTNGGVAKYDNVSEWEVYTEANSGLTGNIWTESVKAGIGTDIWIGTRGGIYLFDQESSWTHFTDANSALEDDMVNSIEVDSDGIVWVANDAASMGIYDSAVWTSVFLPFQVSFSWVITIDKDGYKWVGCQNALVKYNIQGSASISTELNTEQELGSGFILYPNPSTGIVTLSLGALVEGTVEIRVFDAQAREVKSAVTRIAAINKNIELDLSDLSKGAYSIVISSERNTTSRSFLIAP